ncbi:TetR/AcrR family transcriptional regulator [Salibacterium sp. K-3]
MRADAKKNYEHILAVARVVVTEQGVDASLREIARRAGVGLGTLYRHFPTREALLEALLRSNFDELTTKARNLETASSPDDALVSWLRDVVVFMGNYHGVVDTMMEAKEDRESALHASCVKVRAAGTQLLTRAQAEGLARTDMNGDDLFSLTAALAWLSNQPSSAPRAEQLFRIVASAVLTNQASSNFRA